MTNGPEESRHWNLHQLVDGIEQAPKFVKVLPAELKGHGPNEADYPTNRPGPNHRRRG